MVDISKKIEKWLDWGDGHVPATLDHANVDELEGQFAIQAQLRAEYHRKWAQDMANWAANPKETTYKQKAADELKMARDIDSYIRSGQLQEFMEPLRAIAAKSGDKNKIDSWREIRSAAKLFYNHLEFDANPKTRVLASGFFRFCPDFQLYNKQAVTAYRDLRKMRPAILKNLKLDTATGPLARYVQKLPIGELPSWRGLKVFELLPEIHNRKPTFLYPEAGIHYPYLQTLFKLVQRGDIDSATVIATELNINMTTVLNDFKDMERAGIIRGVRLTRPNSPEFYKDGGTEQTLSFQILGPVYFVPVKIVYALKRSGEAYFRDEYLKRADVVIIHDPGDGAKEDSRQLYQSVVAAKQRVAPDKPQLVVVEDVIPNPPQQSVRFNIPYGHCKGSKGIGEFYDCSYTAIVIPLGGPKR